MRLILTTLFFLSILFSNLLSEELKKVSLQLQWKHQFEFAGFYIAKEKGYYKDIGLEVELKEFNSKINITDDVASGKTTFGINYPNIIYEKSNGKDIVILSAILQSSPHALLTLESSGINSIKDFKNKTIMTSEAALNDAPFISMLQKAKLTFDDLEKIPHTFNIDDIVKGKADIVSIFTSNEPFRLKEKGIKYKIWDPRDYGFDFYDVILFTSGKQIKDNPEMVDKFKIASLKGWEYAFSNIEETVDIILKKYNTQNKTKEALIFEAKTLKELAYYETKVLGKIDLNKIQRIHDIYNFLGYTDNKVNLESFIYKKDNNFLTKKEKEYLLTKDKIKICVLPNWLPFEQIDELGKHKGIGNDLLNIISSKIKKEFELVHTKYWFESLQNIRNRKCDVLPVAMDIANRRDAMNFTKPYISEPFVIATKSDKFFIKDEKDLSNKKIGIVRSYAYIEVLKNKNPFIEIVEVKNTKEGLERVNSGELFGYIDTMPTIGYFIQKHGLFNLKIVGKLPFEIKLSMASRNDEPHLNTILEKTLNTISEDEIRKIVGKWIEIRVHQEFDYSKLIYITIFFFIIVLFFIYRSKEINKKKDEFKQLMESSSDGVFIMNTQGGLIDCSNKACEMLGYTKEEMLHLEIFDWEYLYSKEDTLKHLNELTNKTVKLNTKHKRKDGSTYDTEIFVNKITLSNKEVIYASVRDISELKEQELKLKMFTFQQQLAEKTGKVGIYIIYLDDRNDYWNDTMYELYGFNKLKNIPTAETIFKRVYPDDLEYVKSILPNAINSRKEESFEYRISLSNNIKYLSGTLQYYNENNDEFIAGTVLDVTDMRLKDKMLYEQSKMASLGEMIGNIAHQWRQPLNVISISATGLSIQDKMGQATSDKIQECTSQINKSTQYLSETIDTFRNFIKGEKNYENVILQEKINESISLISASLINNQIELRKELDSNIIKMTMVSGEFSQVIVNIFMNAKDILIERGIPNPWIKIELKKEDSKVIISIEDNGGGVPYDILTKIFDPYFTTRNQSQGTGLGLYMSHKIVTESLNGRLYVENTKNGAKFYIEMPIY